MGDLDIGLSGDDPGLGGASECAAPSIVGSVECGVVEHEPSFVGNGHVVSGERGRGEGSKLDARERVERMCDGNEGLIRQVSGSQKQKAIPIVTPKVTVEETYDFSGLSPLKMSGGGAAYAALFDTGHGCEGSLVSSGLVEDCSLMPGGFCCSDVSTNNWVDIRPVDLLPAKPLEDQPKGLPLECVAMQKEQTTLETGTSLQEDNERDRDQILHLETELSGSVQGSPGRSVPSSSVEGSPSEQHCHFTTVENSSSNLSSDAANGTLIHCKPSSATVVRRSNPKRAASLKSNLSGKKPVQSARTRKNLKKPKKAVDVHTSILSGIFNKIKRGRRYSRRPGNLSAWGKVENLISMFVRTDDDVRYDDAAIKIQNKLSKSGRSGLGKKKGHTSHKDGRLVVPKTDHTASTNTMLTKDQMSLHPYFRVVVNSWSSVTTGVSGQVPPFDPMEVGKVEQKTGEHTRGAGIKLLEHDGLHVDKDLESTLTHDISARHLLGEYSGVSSVVGSKVMTGAFGNRHLLDPETSPDSDVYHPAMDIGTTSSACGTPTNQDGGTDESVLVNELMAHYSLNTDDVSAHSETCIPNSTQKKGQTLKKNNEISGCLDPLSEHSSYTQVSNGRGNMSKAAKALKYKREDWRKQENPNQNSLFCSKYIGETTGKGSNCNNFQLKCSLPGSGETECVEDATKKEHGLQNLALSGQDVGNAQAGAEKLSHSLLTDLVVDCKIPRGSKVGLRENGSGCPESPRHMRRNIHGRKKDKVPKPGRKGKTQEKTGAHDACINTGMSSEIACKPSLTESAESSSKIIEENKAVPAGVLSSVMTPIADEKLPEESHHGLEVQPSRPKAAWALCDDCHKWRCIPAELVDVIGEADCKWTCKDNVDKAFADCSIPQEKTDAEINAELEISDTSGGEDCSHPQLDLKPTESVSQPASWTVIKSNLFLHRNRRTQTLDEVMVCHCTPPSNGSLGCGEECLNRMLNIECVKGTCPCGDLCSNQRFQKRKYTKLKSFRCGKKGFGLQLQEDVSHGRFLIEYVGEVLDLTAYEARQRYYASRGQKHFYFMTLNGGEVIDACAKGNLGRFINHSCNPNCRTEKWMVNGEVCIGLFAIRDIKKGEEVTFDYNYVRIFGAAAKRCVCGSAECRGYLGSDPLNAEAIVQGDSDEEYPEPVMVRGDGGRDIKVDRDISDAIGAKSVKYEHDLIPEQDLSSHCPASIDSEIGLHTEDTTPELLPGDHHVYNAVKSFDSIQTQDSIERPLPDAEAPDNSLHNSNGMQIEEVLSKPMSDGQLEVSAAETSITINEALHGSPLRDKMRSNTVQDKPSTSKPRPITKSSHSKIKKAKCSAKNLVPRKAKKLLISSNSGHCEGVEEKLNELLDEEGGISKRKDATKGYLKLLFVTAAEGDNIRGFASQSTRDLSLILDALLKTKSRMVLVDIVNKNGLQMLHNIMKQNRNNFNRIPIIRKLLKVLEFLALKEILTPEHINKSPPCSGMESFKESILILTRHQDVQVHQIARNFRDKWIPRSNRRVEPLSRGNDQPNSQCSHCSRFQSSFKCRHVQRTKGSDVSVSETVHPPTPSCENRPGEMYPTHVQRVLTSVPMTCYNSTNGTRTRKRKSRWDDPSDSMSPDETVERSSKFMKETYPQSEQTSKLELAKMTHRAYKRETSSCDEAANAKDSMSMYLDDDAPPGFGSPRRDHHPQFPSACAAHLDTTHNPQKNDEVPPGFGSSPKAQISSDTSMVEGDVILGRPQERYISHLTVSYGMPVALMQELGTPASEGGNHCQPTWATAPGMPFHPFPPLPSYPHGTSNPTGVAPRSSAHNVTAQQIREAKLDKQCHAGPHPELTVPSTSGERPVHAETGARNSHITERERWPSDGPGRRFFHSNRGNNQRFNRSWPPWKRGGNNNNRFRGGTRNGTSSSSDGFYERGDVINDNTRYSSYHQQRHRN